MKLDPPTLKVHHHIKEYMKNRKHAANLHFALDSISGTGTRKTLTPNGLMNYHEKDVVDVAVSSTSTADQLRCSRLFNVFLFIILLLLLIEQRHSTFQPKVTNEFTLRSLHDPLLVGKSMTFHGGHPSQDRAGQCWCGAADSYCMCTPSLAIDLIIASGDDHLWLVRRKDSPKMLATMGGFVEVGETVEDAVARELEEEMGLHFDGIRIELFGVYSDPRRDNRRSTASVVFVVHLDANHPMSPRAADDVKEVKRIAFADVNQYHYFADHKTILMDYISSVKQRMKNMASEDYGDFATDIVRSTCFASGAWNTTFSHN